MNKKLLTIFLLITITITSFFIFCSKANKEIQKTYKQDKSAQVFDRENELISTLPNSKDFYAIYLNEVPQYFKELILKKEDQYFYLHKGLNPISIIKDLSSEIGVTSRNGSSTITQQLAKILLKNENKRNLKNKIKEMFYTLALETQNSKEDILLMYANSIYFGERMQGLKTASLAYFNADPSIISKEQMFQLIASLGAPNQNNPNEKNNLSKTKTIAKNLNIELDKNYFLTKQTVQNNLKNFKTQNILPLEAKDYVKNKDIQLSIDSKLNKIIRTSLKENLESLKTKKAKNATAVVISLPENEVISMIGSPDPFSSNDGYQINMLKEARSIGSTIKPFIFLKAFEKGMRPYTLIDDREYKYELGDFSSFYPKNYDYKYNGEITAHYALSNSINIGALKTLEFVGLNNFNNFLSQDLELKPVQELENYGIGIALGALEMNLIDLAHIFTIFPNHGKYKNLKFDLSSQNNFEKNISTKPYIELINKILNDRKTSMDQFSAVSFLNLPQKNYALKTGTSQNYKDSLIVGYTPDFLVAVWVGNADNSATEGLSGQFGAGLIWNNIMEIMLDSKYNKNTDFDFSYISSFNSDKNLEYGLKNDNYEKAKNLLVDDTLILNLHDNDIFLFEKNTQIKLKAKQKCKWLINDIPFNETFFKPQKPGKYKITAKTDKKTETIYIYFTSNSSL